MHTHPYNFLDAKGATLHFSKDVSITFYSKLMRSIHTGSVCDFKITEIQHHLNGTEK